MDLAQIEQKLSRRPHSPLFARLADEYLRAGAVEPAKELLLSGLEKYPSYPAAHLVLAHCYAAGEEFPAALRHLRISVNALPEVDHLMELEEEWEARLPQNRPAPPPSPEPAVIEPAAESPVPAPAEPDRALRAAAAPAPIAAPLRTPVPRPRLAGARTQSGRIEDGRIVSKTLAEIYAMQGEYGEAIITYTMLRHQRPQLSAECDLRISELEQALQAKLNQQKLAVSK